MEKRSENRAHRDTLVVGVHTSRKRIGVPRAAAADLNSLRCLGKAAVEVRD